MFLEGEEEISGLPQKSHKNCIAVENLVPCKNKQNPAGWLVLTRDLLSSCPQAYRDPKAQKEAEDHSSLSELQRLTLLVKLQP